MPKFLVLNHYIININSIQKIERVNIASIDIHFIENPNDLTRISFDTLEARDKAFNTLANLFSYIKA